MNDYLFFTHLVGQAIKTYSLETLIEQREFSAIYLARDSISHQAYRLVYLPLPPTLPPQERLVLFGNFQHQARELMHTLMQDDTRPQHPHLLPTVDAGSLQDALYLVTPAVSQMTLTTLLAAQGPMDALTAGLYLDQIASALEYAHHHALLHGDLTTDAIWFYPNGSCTIADLGVMQILQRIRSDQAPASFYSARPNAIPAPEQLLGQAVHTPTDVYALGALLYRLLSGHRVFGDVSPANMLEQHLRAPVPSLATWQRILVGRTDVTDALDSLLLVALAKDPQQRIQHPAQLANAYHQILAPHDPARVPVISPLADALAVPLPEVVETVKGTRTEQHARKERIQALEARRRALLFLGGGAVAAGALALGVRQMLSGGRVTSPSVGGQPTSEPAIVQATTPAQVPATPGQATTPAASPTSVPISGQVIARASAVPLNSAITFTNPNPNSSQAGVLIHLPNGQFVAFDSSCTHRSDCAVQYVPQDKLLECPCHGAEFDPTSHASVVQGPAPTPLAPIAITVYPDGTITAK